MLRTDLKIFKSERMTQNENGGGQRTGNEVENGKLNDVFRNISDIAHAQSAIDISKVYPSVHTNDRKLLQDAHVLINEPPIDPLVDVMLIEAPNINEASERSDIIAAIESGIVPGFALRTGLSAMVAGQTSINMLDLLPSAAPDGEQPQVWLEPGQVVAISVEYTGAESATWPRFTHFCKITGFERNGNVTTQANFEPPLPKSAPGRNTSINSQTRCTVLRAVTSSDQVIYHGTTVLTDTLAGTTLKVEKTSGLVLPRITQTESRPFNQVFIGDEGMIRSVISLPAAGLSYTIEITDFANTPFNQFIIEYTSGGKPRTRTLSDASLSGNELSFVLDFNADNGTNLTIQYYSSTRYASYSNANAVPSNWIILPATVRSGSVLRTTNSQRYSVSPDPTDATRMMVFNSATYNYTLAAIIDPEDGSATYFNNYEDLQFESVIENMAASGESSTTTTFSIPFAEFVTSSLYISVTTTGGTLLTASADSNGTITGTDISGTVTGSSVQLSFNTPVRLSTLFYNVDEIVVLTPPVDLYGVNPLRLVAGGRVPLFRPFGVINLSHNEYQSVTELTPAQTFSLRPQSFIDIVDSEGQSLWHPLDQHFEYNKDTGVLTIVDVDGFTGPFEIIDALSELALVTEVGENTLRVASTIGTFPPGTVVSSVKILKDLQASVSNLFDMTTWQNVWSDTITGDPATASFNQLNYPIEVVNQSAINERWVIIFIGSSTSYRCVGEQLGQIATGDTLNDFAPINPNTGEPYFVIRASGWGGGWNPGECLRFNTIAASRPLVLLRSVSAGHSQIEQDSIRLHFRGNAE
ncbi:hypothetical protein [Alkalimonas mucilaginosa]|uniref:Uncharacterized protein n=1 Tax=Alkalimonas mucilaginosa TaxID=3057676 RepID=A0ABU7JHY2_9GAMM|nr:hypothetical protein [Alkalimonas sp. MEB004]MEE2025026.1 hypothetical protein [Alkalimonas sp. MEB004]